MAKVAVRDVDLEPIDRLEEKVKMLVAMIDRLREDHARASDENTRLGRELDAMRGRLSEAEGAGSEVATLREERDLIRSRVERYARPDREPQALIVRPTQTS